MTNEPQRTPAGRLKYAQIEIVFGCEHFHLYGRHFEQETDHRQLEHIFKPEVSSQGKTASARVERWVLRSQEYDFKTVYCP